jgi:pyruvate dehydrogenase E2 component (dihydrolipoamide acetyltransferase)
MTDIAMPQLSDSMEQGLILQWLIEDGAEVKIGDELVEIETDKATMSYPAEAEGVLQIVVPEGTTVAVGELIARIGDAAAAEATPPRIEELVAPPASNGNAAVRTNGDSTAAATPVARRLAAVHGIALEELAGTGPRGRITKADVLRAGGIEAPPEPRAPAVATAPAGPASPEPPAGGNAGGAGDQVEELSRLQQVVARRMAEAKSTIPHFQVQTEVEIDAALALRAELKALQAAPGRPVPSVNDLIVKACATALREHPHANGSYQDGHFELHGRINIGVAVAAEGALVVPTVFDADTKSLGQIARDVRALAEKVRAGTIAPPELSGATFTVSNLGMFGMTAITPVINPPQAAILGVGAARPTLARGANGEIVDRSLLTLTLSCDHRILYGADAARFLADIKAALEAPLRLAVG